MKPLDSTDAEIDAFDTVCRRLGGFSGRVETEWADAYLTAVAAGPRHVEVEEWLPRLCGDAFERAFADPEDEAQARSALQARMRVIAQQLDPESLLDAPDQLRLQPLVSVWDDETRRQLVAEGAASEEDAAVLLTGALWAEGFLAALDDFADDWRLRDVDDEEAAVFKELLSQVEALFWEDASEEMKAHLERFSPSEMPTREDLIDEACFAIQDLRVWWLDHAPKAPMRRVEPAPGRNDPCPCGSGRKFKRCHGAA